MSYTEATAIADAASASETTRVPDVDAQPPEGLTRDQLERFLLDIRDEPPWRLEADRCVDYYDNNQLDSETLRTMQERGIPPMVRNLVGPTIDVALGMEVKNRRDWELISDREEDDLAVEALAARFHEAARVARAARACSDAYESQLKTGIGWTGVSWNWNPWEPRYLVESVPRNEMWWDWRAKKWDLTDARYLVRRAWYDQDFLQEVFPGQKDLIRLAGKGYASWDFQYNYPQGWGTATTLAQAWEIQRRSTLEEWEWLDNTRGRMLLYEAWYRVFRRGNVLEVEGSPDAVEFNPLNPAHLDAVRAGIGMIRQTLIPKVRLAWFIGPHQIADIPTPYPHNLFPYVPFWGGREDRTGIPYGLIRRMMSPQDEVNARLSKMMWLLSAKRIIMDSDAIDTRFMSLADVITEAARPDATFILNPNRLNKGPGAFQVETDRDLAQQQFEVLKDAQVALQDTGGIYQAMLGKESSAASGVAIANLVEQGATTMAKINDNFAIAKQRTGELLLSLVRRNIGTKPVQVPVKYRGQKTVVILNGPLTIDPETGRPERANDVANLRARCELEEVPQTPAYRQQILQQLGEAMKGLPPEIQSVILDIYMRAMVLPTNMRDEIADRISKVTGFGRDPQTMTPQEQADEQRKTQLQHRAQEAATAKIEGEAKKLEAQVQELLARVGQLESKTAQTRQQVIHAATEPVRGSAEAARPAHNQEVAGSSPAPAT